MYTTTKVCVEFDNTIHNTRRDAEKHLEKLLGDAISALSHKIVTQHKYSHTYAVLSDNIDKLAIIVRLHKELTTPEKDTENLAVDMLADYMSKLVM